MQFQRCLAPLLAFVALVAGFVAPVAAQRDFSKVEIKTEKLADGVYMLVGAGGNLGLSVGNDAVFLIDDQYAPLAPKIQAAVAAITRKPVQFILNTHWHDDHTGGNERFAEAGALIVAHDNVRRRMSSAQMIDFLKLRVEPSPKAALPLVTFGADVTFHINGDEIVALHCPAAHTDGDAIVHFRRADVIHMGDIFFNTFYPFIDTSSGGSADGVIAAVDRALALATEKTKIIPGHGPLATKADLKAYRDMIATVQSRIRSQMASGKSVQEIVASQPTKEFDEKWGNGFIKPDSWVTMLATALRR